MAKKVRLYTDRKNQLASPLRLFSSNHDTRKLQALLASLRVGFAMTGKEDYCGKHTLF